MKKITAFIVLALIISSCGNQVSILKRHYTKGFYVQNTKTPGKAISKTDVKSAGLEKMEPLTTVFLKEKIAPTEISASIKENTSANTDKKVSYQSQLKKHIVKASSAIKINNLKGNISILPLKKETSKKGSSDVDLLILIILCLFPFINLIAMYLHDGKSITMNFWICLILDILFFLPGIIFALLVVLDVINLG